VDSSTITVANTGRTGWKAEEMMVSTKEGHESGGEPLY
jgi:hypothetical protein